jgi:dienelactone hydrolase
MQAMTIRDLTDNLTALYREGKYAEALELVEQNAGHFPEQFARTTFWKMCLLSLCNRAQDTITVFQEGLDSGLWWHEELLSDPDLNAVRDLPEFQRLMAVSHERYKEARTQVERDYTILLPEAPAPGMYPLLIALHGRSGEKEGHLEHWKPLSDKGWLVLLAQSTQPLFQGSYCWDDATQGLEDLLYYYEQISQQYQIDSQRVVIAGFSQGSGMAIYTALTGKIPVRGFIGIGTWWADPDQLDLQRKQIRGYFITGEKDHTLDRAREIQEVLRRNNIEFAEEVHADLGHEFSSDFGTSFDKAIDFIFKEHE